MSFSQGILSDILWCLFFFRALKEFKRKKKNRSMSVRMHQCLKKSKKEKRKRKKWSMPFFRPSPFRRHFKCTCETSWYGQFHAHVSWALSLWNKCLNRHYWIVHTHVKSNEAVRTISSLRARPKHWAIETVLSESSMLGEMCTMRQNYKICPKNILSFF